MPDILVVAELAEGKVKKATYSAITFARQVAQGTDGRFSILVLGAGAAAAATELAGFGASTMLVADDAGLAHYTAERFAPTIIAAAKSFGVVVATATSFGKDLLPRVAAALDAGYAGDISAVQVDGDKLIYKRPMFAGNAFGYCTVSTAIQVVTVRQSEFAPAEPSGGTSPIQTFAVVAPGAGADRVEFVSFDQVKTARPALTDAKVVVSGGRALKERFNEILEPLADTLGAAIGASRAACDAGYAPSDYQVGQTGKIVAPQLYFAIGISGAIQHLAGMKGSKVIVAINKDGEAPIFQVADYGLVADLFQAVPELNAAIKATQNQT
ncbi:MAG: electron transfer flavoprotein subunit alpha/FixB family protein [Myxococcales bacterium]|nr:electron transfer flavoprotein subunit alpha/FixB family protein [Polyangiaceae bacterium]MDW8249865.1 electron transfer flavoprotein subunit alpha/FixB family protein [Myxococcales bacterium]